MLGFILNAAGRGFPSPLFNTSRLCPEKQSDHKSQVPLDSTSPCVGQPHPTPLLSPKGLVTLMNHTTEHMHDLTAVWLIS